jgi:glycosyltransferase involved in cell wall biosynthesis
MKIAMIHSPILGRGGGERQILRLAIELQKMGNTVEIFTSALNVENSYPNMIKDLTINVIPHPLGKKMPKWLAPEAATKSSSSGLGVTENSALKTWMRNNMGRQFYTIPYDLPSMINIGKKIPKGFDIINNHNYPSEWAAFYAKKRLKKPVVWMCNEPPFWFFVPELRRGLRKVNWPVFEIIDKVSVDYIDEILVLSKIAGGYVSKAYKRNWKVITSGVDTELLEKATGASIREQYKLKDKFVLLQVGNIELNKRQTDSLKALKILSEKYDNITLMFDGGGRTDEIVKLSKKLGIQDKVVFRRSSNDKELAEVYAACDVFLFPAQITWGLAVVEAMVAAKPVIVSVKCGVSEIIQNGVNGVTVEHQKPEEIAKHVENLISDSSLRRTIGKNAYNFVKENVSWQKCAQNIEKIFQKTIERHAI